MAADLPPMTLNELDYASRGWANASELILVVVDETGRERVITGVRASLSKIYLLTDRR